jgi:uncharacterized protein
VNKRVFIVLELTAVVALMAADQFDLIRAPLSLTIPLILIGWLSLRLRGLRWSDMGLRPPGNWKKTIAVATIIASVHQLFSTFVLIPFLQRVTGQPIDLTLTEQIKGNLGMLGISLVVAWLLAAFGEEMVYRGYMLNRFADILEPRSIRWVIGYLVSVLLFAWVHQYQGMVGVIDNIVSAAMWGGLYLYSGRNLWMSIIAHGVYDTIAFIFAYLSVI